MPTTTTFDLDGIAAGLTAVTPATLGWDSLDANLTPEFEESAAMITRTAWNGDVVLSSTGNLSSTDRYFRPFTYAEALGFIGNQGEGVVTRFKLSFEKGTGTGFNVVSQNFTNRPGGDYGRLSMQIGVGGNYGGDGYGVFIRPTECQDPNDFGGSAAYGLGVEYNEIFYLDVYQWKSGPNVTTSDWEWAYAINGRMMCLKQHGSFRCGTAQELLWNTSFWDATGLATLYYLNVHEVTVTYGYTGSSIEANYDGIEDSSLGAWTDDSIVCLHGALYQVAGQAATTASTSFLKWDPCWDWPNISATGGTIDTQTVDANWQNGSTFSGLQYIFTDPDFEVSSKLFRIPQTNGVAQLTIPIEEIGDNGVNFIVERDLGAFQTPIFQLRIDTGTGATTNLKWVDSSGTETDTGITLTRTANRYTIFCFIRSDRVGIVVEDRQVNNNTTDHLLTWTSDSEGINLPTSSDIRMTLDMSQSGTSSDFRFYGPTWGNLIGTIESSYVSTAGFTDGTRPARIGARDRRLWDANSGRGGHVMTAGGPATYPHGPFANLGRSGGDLQEWLDLQIDDSSRFFDAWMGELRVYDGRVNYIDTPQDGAAVQALFERLRDLANAGAGGCTLQVATTPSPDGAAWTTQKTDDHRESNALLREDVEAGNWAGHYFADMTGSYASEAAATADLISDTTDVHPGEGRFGELNDWRILFNEQLSAAPSLGVRRSSAVFGAATHGSFRKRRQRRRL